ncbi:hypothetical protein ACVTMO_15950 [Pseudomonas segetis]|uniref:Uncharacterized protein n=1 Tax=Pseudomonas segetis TaxID=298908 RepID=A0A239BVY3_9PSED|nr:hypothetical protein [Pseudomonas segetis]SNS12205.1 hypothetical protein SAMN05216255_1375 [Pseudomonas segetis]
MDTLVTCLQVAQQGISSTSGSLATAKQPCPARMSSVPRALAKTHRLSHASPL